MAPVKSISTGLKSIVSAKEIDLYAFQKKYINSRTSLGNISSHIMGSRVLSGIEELQRVEEEVDPNKESTRLLASLKLEKSRIKGSFTRKMDEVL